MIFTNKYFIYSLLIFFSLSFKANSQVLIRQSINSFGSSHKSSNIYLRQTVGQSSNTECFEKGEKIRQGFQQPFNINSNSKKIQSFEISLFPNPTRELVQIKIDGIASIYNISINDLLGKELFRLSNTQTQETSVNLSSWERGLYTITVTDINGIKVSQKIIKQ